MLLKRQLLAGINMGYVFGLRGSREAERSFSKNAEEAKSLVVSEATYETKRERSHGVVSSSSGREAAMTSQKLPEREAKVQVWSHLDN